MRTIGLAVMLSIVSVSSAFAGDLDKILGYAGAAAAVYETVRAVTERPKKTPVAPKPQVAVDASAPRIRVAIAPVKVAQLAGNCSWGQDRAAEFVEERLYSVGPAVGNRLGIVFLERARLDEAIAEQKLAENPAMDPSTFEPMGQGLGAQAQLVVTVLRMTVEERRVGFDASNWNRGVEYHETLLLVTVWLQARVVGIGQYTIAPTTESKQVIQVSLDRSGAVGGWRLPDLGYERRDDVVASALYSATDRAAEDLLYKLLPLLRKTAPVREGWSFDPDTGAPLGAPKCPLCSRELPAGAKFCPRDGTRITSASPAGAPEYAQ